MKKFLCLAMSLALAASLCMTAFAADPTIDVTGTYQSGASATPVYSIGYSHGDMKFIYSAGSKGTWDPQTHTYSGASDTPVWKPATATSGDIEVVNHSNVAITVNLSFAGLNGITGGFTDNAISVASAEGTTYDNAPSVETTFGIISGTLNEGDTDVALGTITISID